MCQGVPLLPLASWLFLRMMSCAPSLSSPGRSRWALGRNGRGNSMPAWPQSPEPQSSQPQPPSSPSPLPAPVPPAPVPQPLPPCPAGWFLQLWLLSSLVFTEQLGCLQQPLRRGPSFQRISHLENSTGDSSNSPPPHTPGRGLSGMQGQHPLPPSPGLGWCPGVGLSLSIQTSGPSPGGVDIHRSGNSRW